VLAAVGAAAVAALPGYASLRLHRAEARFEAEAGSLEPASYAPAPVEREQNAATWLAAGIDAAGLTTAQPEIVTRRSERLGSPWTAEDEAAFDALIERLAPARAHLDRAAALERSSQGIDYTSLDLDLELPDVLAALRIARIVDLHCDLALRRGAIDGAIADVALLERMAAIQRREPLILTALVGAAIERIYLGRLELVLGAVQDAAQLERLGADLDHLERSAAPLRRVLAREGAWGHAAMRRSANDPCRQQLASPRLTRWLTELSRAARALLRVEWVQQAELLEAYTALVEGAGEPIAGLDAPQSVARLLEKRPLWPRGPVTEALLPNLADAIHKDQATTSMRRLARTALRLRSARLQGGSYPASLPDPPVSDYAGDVADYRRLDDGSVEIALVETQRAWNERYAKLEAAHARNFSWRLPP
jgi:hypothetical protein